MNPDAMEAPLFDPVRLCSPFLLLLLLYAAEPTEGRRFNLVEEEDDGLSANP